MPELCLELASKPKPKTNTERTGKGCSEVRKSVELNSKAISLLEKKKQYSQALRQKNVQRVHTQASAEKTVPKSLSSSVVLKESTSHNIPNESFFSEVSCRQE